MKKYRELTPEERWEITDNLTPQDIMNGEVDHYLNDNVFWREVDYEHPDLVSFLDNRYAIINKEYGLEKLHKLSQYPRKKWEQSIAWYNHENNQNTNENKNMKQNKIKITENELKQIVAESVKKILKEEFQINLTNNGKEGWNNVNKWRAAANELQTKGSVIINIPLDYDNFLQANLMRTQRGGIYLETKDFRKEYASISDAFNALQDYANNMMNN